MNSVQKMSEPEAETNGGNLPVTASMKLSGNLKHIVNHDDVFEV
jgi:erbb2-interacting protein